MRENSAKKNSDKSGKTAVLFTGQGTQWPGMGKDFYETLPVFRALVDRLDPTKKVQELSWNIDREEQAKTANAQRVLFLYQTALLKALEAEGLVIDGFAGLSLGEFAALVGAGTLGDEEAFGLVGKRADAMAKACQDHPSSMIALLSRDEDAMEDAIARASGLYGAEVANRNCPGQVVVSLAKEQREKALGFFAELKCKAIGLEVEGGFHASFMEDAGKALAEELERIAFTEPKKDLYLSVEAKRYAGEDLALVMKKQVSQTTYFQRVLEQMLADGYTKFIEIAGKGQIKGFLQKILKAMDAAGLAQEVEVEVDVLSDRASWEQFWQKRGNDE